MELEFKEKYGTEDAPCTVYFKNTRVFTIRFENHCGYWICTGNCYINFKYFSIKGDIDFIEPYKYSKTLEGAKKNCKHIMYSYINWLTETKGVDKKKETSKVEYLIWDDYTDEMYNVFDSKLEAETYLDELVESGEQREYFSIREQVKS